MATHVRQTVDRQPATVCDTQKTIAEYVNKLPCMFISAFRSDLSDEENAERSRKLEKKVIKSDLIYVKCIGHRIAPDGSEMTEISFCVVNNGYNKGDFIKLGIDWCEDLEKKAVMLAIPIRERVNQRRLLKIEGRVYNGEGELKEELEFGVPFEDIEQCFAKAYGKTFELEEKAEIVVTDLTPPGTVNGHMLAHYRFEGKYPWIK